MPQQNKNSKASKTTRPPVIMQVIPELSAGGAEQGCIDIAAELVRVGATSIVVSNGGSRLHELTRHGAIHIDLPVHSKNPYTMWRNVARLKKLIKKHKVDIVHARSRAPAWSAWKACEDSSTHFMATCHSQYKIHDSKLKRFYNSSIARGKRVIAVSHYLAQYLVANYAEVDAANIRIVHRGVTLEKFSPHAVTPAQMIKVSSAWRVPDDATVILLPARITRLKGHHVLIDAMAKINRKDLFCVIIGDDQGRNEYRAELEDTIETKGLGRQIRMVDHCTEMPAAYMLSAVIISASTQPEGFGRIAIEAQAMGKPMIATDHGGSKETIIPGQTGWLVPPNDSDALAAAITQALSLTEQEKNNLAYNAMTHIAANFTNRTMIDNTLNVYTELLNEQ